MKNLGFIFLLGSLMLFIYGYNYEVQVEYNGMKLSNVNLLDQRQNIYIASGFAFAIGAILIAIAASKKSSEDDDVCEEERCSVCGQAIELDDTDVSAGRYVCPICKSSNVVSRI